MRRNLLSKQLKLFVPGKRNLCQRSGRRRSSIGWRTSSRGAFHGKSGGAIRFRRGMGQKKVFARRSRERLAKYRLDPQLLNYALNRVRSSLPLLPTYKFL